MQDPEAGIWMIANGEISTLQEVRHDLELRGYAFPTETDTEVIPKAVAAYGLEAPPLLRGMLAFAIWNMREEPLSIGPRSVGCHTAAQLPYPGCILARVGSTGISRWRPCTSSVVHRGLDSLAWRWAAVQDATTMIENVYEPANALTSNGCVLNGYSIRAAGA